MLAALLLLSYSSVALQAQQEMVTSARSKQQTRVVSVYYPGTEAYIAKAGTLKLTPLEARKIIISLYDRHPALMQSYGMGERPWRLSLHLVGDYYCYLPPRMPVKEPINPPLRGLYVNGMTGESEYRDSLYLLRGGVLRQKTVDMDRYTCVIKITDQTAESRQH